VVVDDADDYLSDDGGGNVVVHDGASGFSDDGDRKEQAHSLQENLGSANPHDERNW
jgi:hypothetical protein